jgi:hypothetical protein
MPSSHRIRGVFQIVHRRHIWRLFAALTPAASSPQHIPDLCVLVMRDGSDEGTSCTNGFKDASGAPRFDQADPTKIDFEEFDVAGSSLVYGIAANAATTVEAITPSGKRIAMPLSQDHAFLHFCGRFGCGCEIERIESLAANGKILAVEGGLATTWCDHRR